MQIGLETEGQKGLVEMEIMEIKISLIIKPKRNVLESGWGWGPRQSLSGALPSGRKRRRRYPGLYLGFSSGGGGVGVGDDGTYHGVWCNWPSVWWTEPRSEPDYSNCSYMVLGGVAAQYVVGNDCIMF